MLFTKWKSCITLCIEAIVFALWASSIQAQGMVSLGMTPPRLEEDIHIDGVLDEQVWSEAVSLDGFWDYLPVDERPAQDSTEVLVWYAPTAIYFGIRCYSTGEVRATLADRDKIAGDDYVNIVLDTFNDQRQAFVFGVNPFGVQADGILRDNPPSASIRANGNRTYAIDLTPDFVYTSKGQLTESGYEVEIEVPFKSLRYQRAPVQTWGINIIRKVQHSGYETTWTQVVQEQASFMAQGGTLENLTDLRRGLVLDVTPEVTAGVNGTPTENGWHYARENPELGANVRWGITNNLTLNGTVNPDFSQVEADVAQLEFDPRQALFYPEKRPFFLDGIELFRSPVNLVYSRRIVSPIGAAKVTGKVGNTNIALLSAADSRETSANGNDVRSFNLLRINQDLKGQSTLGAIYTDKVDGMNYNRVISGDGNIFLGDLYSVRFQTAASFTRNGDFEAAAPLWYLRADRAGRRAGFLFRLKGFHPDFRTESGILSRRGIAQATFIPRITRFGKEGSTLESWTGSVVLDGTWGYDRFLSGTIPDDAKLHLRSSFSLRGGWQLAGSVLVESFRYAGELYTNHFVERHENGVPVDTVAYVGTERLPNFDVDFNLETPRFQKFSASFYTIFGQDVNFFEWASAYILLVTTNIDWRPTEQVRVNFQYQHQQYNRKTDRSLVGLRRVPRLKVEYQLTRSIFLRVVGQYDSSLRDSLRDDSRTNDPILIYSAGTGAYNRTQRIRHNNLRVDWLFSYRPTPGTVLFLGYGSSMDETNPFTFRGLRRTSDGFFFKLSYLFRV